MVDQVNDTNGNKTIEKRWTERGKVRLTEMTSRLYSHEIFVLVFKGVTKFRQIEDFEDEGKSAGLHCSKIIYFLPIAQIKNP